MRRVDCLMPNRKNEKRNTERRNRKKKKGKNHLLDYLFQ